MYKLLALVLAIYVNFTACAYAQTVKVSGECVGVKVYTDGLIITDTQTLTQSDGKKVNIAAGYGIKKGDIIKKVNGVYASSAAVISDAIKDGNEITLTLAREEKEFDITVTPAKTNDGPKLGLWLRDSTAGMGTLTCYTDDKFIALGHGICDIDTGNIMPVREGIIQECNKIEITKGRPGMPGAITGDICGKYLGKVLSNDECGLSGTMSSPIEGKDLATADKHEVKTGKASILANVDGCGVKEYEIEIKNIYPSSQAAKDMVIEITDKELIKKTGGIVQGMSGAPILQNGKLVGAVTHVFVNNPTRGYGIFIENMLNEA